MKPFLTTSPLTQHQSLNSPNVQLKPVAIIGILMSHLEANFDILIFHCTLAWDQYLPLQWRHNEHNGVSNHQPHDCLLKRLFKSQIRENIKDLRHWSLWGEFTGDFPAQMPSSAENVSIWWHHHAHWTPGYSCHSHPHQTLEPINIFISSGLWSYSWHPQMLPNPGVILASLEPFLTSLPQQTLGSPFTYYLLLNSRTNLDNLITHWSHWSHTHTCTSFLLSWGATLDILFQQKVEPFWLCWTNGSHMFQWLGQWFFF